MTAGNDKRSPETAAQRAIEDGESRLAAGQPDAAAAAFRRALDVTPGSFRAWVGLGRALNNLRSLDAAADAFSRAVALRPDDASAQNFLGHVERARGHDRNALVAFQRAVELDSGLAKAHYNLGTVLAAQRQYGAAIDAIERSLALEPANVPALLTLAEVSQFADRHADAIAALERAAALEPGSADHPAALGDLHYSLGEVERARDAYDTALLLDPTHAGAVAGRALLHELWGDIDVGWALVAPWLGREPKPAGIVHAAARLLRRKGLPDKALALMDTLGSTTIDRDPAIGFTLGELLDRVGRYDEAFAAFAAANRCKPDLFDAHEHERTIDALIRFFDAARFDQLRRAHTVDPRPLFIVGMPRSGTTLVEQILASHDAVHAGGERFEIPAIVDSLEGIDGGFPHCLAGVGGSELDALAHRYRAAFGPVEAGASLYTDKLPKNFLWLGLIALMFPNARVVVLNRDPRDVGLSVFFQNLNVRSDPWACTLDGIAAYTRAHDRLMRHWHDVLPLPLLTVDYARLVDDLEGEVRRLLDFLNLPFQAGCLAFHRTKRLVNTASYAQVRQPIYRSSVDRWRNYERHLGPLAALPE